MTLLIALAIIALAGVQGSTVYTVGNGVSLPQVVKRVKAEYTNEARQIRIEGKVGLSAVVQSDAPSARSGSPTRSTRSAASMQTP